MASAIQVCIHRASDKGTFRILFLHAKLQVVVNRILLEGNRDMVKHMLQLCLTGVKLKAASSLEIQECLKGYVYMQGTPAGIRTWRSRSFLIFPGAIGDNSLLQMEVEVKGVVIISLITCIDSIISSMFKVLFKKLNQQEPVRDLARTKKKENPDQCARRKRIITVAFDPKFIIEESNRDASRYGSPKKVIYRFTKKIPADSVLKS
ncbi:hypothetical protein SELMODRAFT_423040 [Selaginella moellendorffii]|uniref:Uncharacterized protein n=1 Tax=Selaginella moellendorffii TaxID=88036 RepID=D8SKD3_SELML|nr:hypothetical protein SELMODRAFT_423040 [Selaginella moellendorffii]